MTRRLFRLRIPLARPFATATGTVAARELCLLRLEADDGLCGFGEAAPLPGYDAEDIDLVIAALRSPGSPHEAPPQARLAEELAALDLEGRRAGRPAIGGGEVEVNLTLPAGAVEDVAASARAGAAAGFRCFKLKVGLEDDRERAAAVRAEIGPVARLRVDANGTWTVEEAERALAALADLDLELVEQPCRTVDELADLRRRVDVPIAADESIASSDDVRQAAAADACDLVCIKLSRSGGVEPARKSLREARRLGLGTYLASTFDGPWAIAAALQLAASEGVSTACGLATLSLFEEPWASALGPVADGFASASAGPGLGVDLPPGALAGAGVEELE